MTIVIFDHSFCFSACMNLAVACSVSVSASCSFSASLFFASSNSSVRFTLDVRFVWFSGYVPFYWGAAIKLYDLGRQFTSCYFALTGCKIQRVNQIIILDKYLNDLYRINDLIIIIKIRVRQITTCELKPSFTRMLSSKSIRIFWWKMGVPMTSARIRFNSIISMWSKINQLH